MKKGLIIIISLFLFIPVIKAEKLELAPNAKSALLMEASTGEIIYQKGVHVKYAPASMTKMMSMLLFIEALESNALGWEEKLKISEHAASMGGSQIFLETNEIMSVRDLFKGVAIGSANDATVALAERIGGTEEHFVELMNQKVKELDLKNTNFKNSSGLDEANHYSSAYDMAAIARELIKHSKVLEYTSIYEDYLRQEKEEKFWLVNTNKLVRFYEGVDGLKTGYTDEAGYCITATAKRNNMRLIAVVFGEPDSKTRNSEISKMLDYGYNSYNVERLLSTDSKIGTMKVIKGKRKTMEIVPVEDINMLYKKGSNKQNFTYDIKVNIHEAPIKKGDVIGEIKILEDGEIIRKVGVTVIKDVEKASFFNLYIRYLLDFVKGM